MNEDMILASMAELKKVERGYGRWIVFGFLLLMNILLVVFSVDYVISSVQDRDKKMQLEFERRAALRSRQSEEFSARLTKIEGAVLKNRELIETLGKK